MRSWLGILCYCLLLIVMAILPVSALSIDTLQQQKQQIQQQQKNLVWERDRLTHIQTAAEKYLTGLNQSLDITTSQLTNTESRLQLATVSLQRLEADLAIAVQDYEKKQSATVARLRFLQRSPLSQGWAVLLQSQNISDFIRRRYQLKLVYRADQRILEKLAIQANRLLQQKTAVEGQKNEIALINQQLLAQKADYQTQSQTQSQLIQRLNSDRLALIAAQNQLEKDSQSLTILIQQKVATQSLIRGTGLFTYPSDAPTSSPFGWRIHPILGYRRFHSGLDFAASYGSPIRAADSGKVILAGWYGGYGKAVIINHGGGMTTLYGHTSELYVVEGQTVQKGQAIAAVGSTGFSTGPHLHFEVRRAGEPVNPGNYL